MLPAYSTSPAEWANESMRETTLNSIQLSSTWKKLTLCHVLFVVDRFGKCIPSASLVTVVTFQFFLLLLLLNPFRHFRPFLYFFFSLVTRFLLFTSVFKKKNKPSLVFILLCLCVCVCVCVVLVFMLQINISFPVLSVPFLLSLITTYLACFLL